MSAERIRVGNLVTITKRGKKGIYTAEFSSNGRHCRRSLKTPNLKVAREKAVKLEAALSAGTLKETVPPVKLGDAAGRYIAYCRTEGLRPKTIRKYRTLLELFTSFAAGRDAHILRQISSDLIDKFRVVRKLTLSPKSMHNEGVTLKGFFKWCRQRSLIPENPMEAMTFRKAAETPRGGPSLEQLTELLDRAPDARLEQFALLAFTGCRSGELQRLRVEDVDLKGGWIHIVSREGAETKTGHSRQVPIHSALRALLVKLPKRCGPWFFTSPPSKKYPSGDHWVSTKRLNEDFLKLLKLVGLPAGRAGGYTLHSLRHSFETICVNAGIPQRVIDTWIGHRSDKSMASRYYKLSDAESQRFICEAPFKLKGRQAVSRVKEQKSKRGA